jgi:hypothetical protein
MAFLKLYLFYTGFHDNTGISQGLEETPIFLKYSRQGQQQGKHKYIAFSVNSLSMTTKRSSLLISTCFISQEEVAKSSEEEEKGMGDSTESEKDVRQEQVGICS